MFILKMSAVMLCSCRLKQSAQQKTIHLTLININMGGKYVHQFCRIFAIFSQSYMKNKIGILENDIYIFSP